MASTSPPWRITAAPSPPRCAALSTRDTECGIDGCPCRDHLEIHHLQDWALTLETTLDGVVRICPFHHDLITYGDYTLEPLGDHLYRLVPPDEERGPP